MRIQNNVTALNTHRMYAINNANIAKSSEKLSSGYRINRAGDDAAGLAISEKMRAQIRGLNMASKNSQDAISLVQTAEGALQEAHNITQRMRELAVQSSSDTNTDFDRSALNDEFQELKKELDDIANKTTFNDQKLIDGAFRDKIAYAANGTTWAGEVVAFNNIKSGSYNLSLTQRTIGKDEGSKEKTTSLIYDTSASSNITAVTFTWDTSVVNSVTSKYNGTWELKYAGGNQFKLVSGEKEYTATVGDALMTKGLASGGTFSLSFAGLGTLAMKLNTTLDAGNNGNWAETLDGVAKIKVEGGRDKNEGVRHWYAKLGDRAEVEITDKFKDITFSDMHISGTIVNTISTAMTDSAFNTTYASFKTIVIGMREGNALTIQTGANMGDELKLNLQKMDAKSLGVEYHDIATQKSASASIDATNRAVNMISTMRAKLGATQNRLNHKIANLDTSAENLQAAESRIRDVDMAKEMVTFNKQNILSQAATAMLAQANQAPQNVLQLLR